MTSCIKTTTTASPSLLDRFPASVEELYRPRDDEETARFLGVKADTLKTWRRESRRSGKRIGPSWVETAGAGTKTIPRYRLIDIIDWQERQKTQLEPGKKLGRPRKSATAAEVL